MFKKFFDRFKPIELDDPFFGRLCLMTAPRGRPAHWEAERTFGPTGETVEVFLDTASAAEPSSEAQRDFFRRVERDYDSLCEIVAEAFRGDEWARDTMEGRPFQQAFRLGSLSIPLCLEPDEEWELSFDSLNEHEDHLFSATMQGLRVTHTSVDG